MCCPVELSSPSTVWNVVDHGAGESRWLLVYAVFLPPPACPVWVPLQVSLQWGEGADGTCGMDLTQKTLVSQTGYQIVLHLSKDLNHKKVTRPNPRVKGKACRDCWKEWLTVCNFEVNFAGLCSSKQAATASFCSRHAKQRQFANHCAGRQISRKKLEFKSLPWLGLTSYSFP